MKKTAPALALLLALAGFAAVGCGAAKKIASGTLTVTGTTTISSVATGALISCKDGTGAKVPPLGNGVTGIGDGPAMSSEIRLTHRQDGSAVVVCRQSSS